MGRSHAIQFSQGRDGTLFTGANDTIRVEASPIGVSVLQNAAFLHRSLGTPFVQPLDEGPDWVDFSFKGRATLSIIVEGVLAGELPPVPFSVAIAFIECIMDAFDVAAQGGAQLRSLGPGNILISPDGDVRFLGLGGLRISSPVFCTPGVALGGPATQTSDMYAALQVLRFALPAVRLPSPLKRMFKGEPRSGESYVWKQVQRFETAYANPLSKKPTLGVHHARKAYHAFWRLCGVTPDDSGLRAYARNAYATLWPQVTTAAYDPQSHSLTFKNGHFVDLKHQPVQARLLSTLVESHFNDECTGLSADALIKFIWPDERMSAESAKNRLYVAVAKIRKAGLSNVLVLDSERKYRFADEFQIEIRSPA